MIDIWQLLLSFHFLITPIVYTNEVKKKVGNLIMSLLTEVKERISRQLVNILDLDENCQSCIINMLQKPKDSSKGEYCLNIQRLVYTCSKCGKLNSK